METTLIHADRQTGGQTNGWTDMAKVIPAFRECGKAPKNCTATLTVGVPSPGRRR